MEFKGILNTEELLEGESELTVRAKEIAIHLLDVGVKSVDPYTLIKKNVTRDKRILHIFGNKIRLEPDSRIFVVGGGKASGKMAVALEEQLGDLITEGLVNVLEGTETSFKTRRIKINPAGHPIPNRKGYEGTAKMLEMLEGVEEKDVVICLISGGGSAMIFQPWNGISIKDYQELTSQLLKSGADINEVNVVRKHISKVKGGRLAYEASPAKIYSLIVSDVVGDPLETIASGPTSPDPSTFKDAYSILKKYDLMDVVPESILNVLKLGINGSIEDTPKPDSKTFQNVRNIIIANNLKAVNAIAEEALKKGFNVLNLCSYIEGEAREVGKVFASIIQGVYFKGIPIPPPAVIVGGGETTVKVTGKGVGGRNQEVALSAVQKLDG